MQVQCQSGLGTTRQGYHLGQQTFESKPTKIEHLAIPTLSPSGLGFVFNGRIITETGPVSIKDLIVDFDPKETNPDGSPVSESHYWDSETLQLLQEYARQHPEFGKEAETLFATVTQNQSNLTSNIKPIK